MRIAKVLLFSAFAGLGLPAARADVQPHPLFADHMVLQRGIQVPVFGSAAPGERVTVTLAGPATAGQPAAIVATAAADDKGRWLVKFPPQQAGTGRALTVKGDKNTVSVTDVAVGDVWVCGGQSNMQWEMWRLTKDDQGKKVSAAANNPNVRLFTVPHRPSETPLPSLTPRTQKRDDHKAEYGKWEPATPDSVLEFSAVGFYFGRDLQKSLGVPIGLIACNVGGTPAEAWTSRESLEAVPELRHYITALDKRLNTFTDAKAEEDYKKALEKYEADAEKAKKEGKQPPRKPQKASRVDQNTPASLYNGMLYSIMPYAIGGAIWYQGESNANRAAEYYTLYRTMIQDWRRHWGYEFPFLAAQLAPYRGNQGPAGVDYAEVRDALFQATRTLPRVGVAVITDVGDETDIHPQRKEPVGARLALAARAIAYGDRVEFSGPVYKSLTVSGNKGVVAFHHVGGGLVCKGDELHGFTVCGDDGKFRPAKAKIVGETVEVTCDEVPKPVAVRFGWVNFAKPELNFFNQAGLPAVPFRTDNIPLTTLPKDKK
jgi:sialate O-acetylesterase